MLASTSSGRAVAVNGLELALALVVTDEGRGLLVIDLEALTDGDGLIVIAVGERPAAHRANARICELGNVERAAALAANAAAP